MPREPKSCEKCHSTKRVEPKTAEQINTDKLLLWINRYLTRRFIADPSMLPEDECEKEAKVILDKCREQIRKQVIGAIKSALEKRFKLKQGCWTRDLHREGSISCGSNEYWESWWQLFKRGE